MNIRILKTYNTLIAGILTLLGFSTACSSSESEDEYGSPSATYIVNGKVTSSETNQPIKGIEVNLADDVAYTDENGDYKVSIRVEPTTDYPIRFNDVDGESNGTFNNLDTIVDFKNSKFSNGDGYWYEGETKKEFNVNLTSKNGSN